MTEAPLDGRVAVVTGAARNIGRAIAVGLARAGAKVVVNAQHSAGAAEEVAQAIRADGGAAMVHLADVTDERAAQGLAEAAVAFGGGIDILVNNAAVRRETPFAELTYAEWREVLGVILDGAFLCTRAALPAPAALGGGQRREHRRHVGPCRFCRARPRRGGEGRPGRADAGAGARPGA